MEADWSAEIGAGLPTIAVPWPGFIDLTGLPAVQIAREVSEAANLLPLAETLAFLNAAGSLITTAKCDVWQLNADEIDVYEFDTTAETAACGQACYIDILPHSAALLQSFKETETWARSFARALTQVPLQSARAEIVIRAAGLQLIQGRTRSERSGYALTLYTFGCGRNPASALSAWSAALNAAAAATIATIPQAEETIPGE